MRDIRTSDEGNAPGERSIRNISVGRRPHARPPSVIEDHSEPPRGPIELPHRRARRKKNRFWLLALIVVVVCAVLGLLLSTVFAGATVTVHPRTEVVTVPASLTAAPQAPVGTLAYQTITVTRSSSVSVPAQGTQRVSRAASGSILISNAYNSASQRLIANTRFETADGKIYRIRDSVTVPGATGSGSALTAGTVSAAVYADSPGPEYNKAAGTTFTIPGFKGDPRYGKFSAVAQGAISGGFIGDEPAVASADLATAKSSLEQKIDGEVRAAAVAEIPEGYSAIPGTLGVVFSDLTQTAGENKTATLSQSATATGIIVRQADLASAIARSAVEDYAGEAVAFGDAQGMDVALASTSARTDGTITLTLRGQAKLVWQFDPGALTQALLGKPKSEFEEVIRAFEPAVAKADASIRPFWHSSFPSDATKIKIKTAE
jgi:hypothetical protein